MSLDNKVGFCLPSQDIRDSIMEGRIIVPRFDESRIQPSSFEPVVGDELFILDTETNGLFRPQAGETVYRTLLQLPGRQRRKVNINNGFEIKRGFTYLVPLEERVVLNQDEFIKSSPKSSFGRLFPNTRLLADYNPSFDEINSQYKHNSELMLWLLLQPLAFNLILQPGIPLNQLRFHTGYGSQLTPTEIIEEFKKNPFLFSEANGKLVPAKPFVTDTVLVHVDLSGKHTEGITGLRARYNPTPIDLSKEGEYEAEDYFEPLNGNRITISRLEHYLLSSKELVNVPDHLNMELKSHSHVGFIGPLHFAGFLDNGFKGCLVFEVRSDELSNVEVKDGMPISKLDIFRTGRPDKVYGVSIGSHYQEQVGSRPPKYFKPFNFTFAARNYKKLDRLVLVQGAGVLTAHRKNRDSFEFITEETALKLKWDIENGFFQSRYDCEFDTEVLQPIPYIVLYGPDGTVFSYVRAENIQDYGDERLFGKHSVGVGGHIIQSDGPRYVERCLEREVTEEVEIRGNITKPKLVGTLMAYDNEVDRVHFGLIFTMLTDGSVTPKESSFVSGKMMDINELIVDPNYTKKYETWSRILIPYIKKLHKL